MTVRTGTVTPTVVVVSHACVVDVNQEPFLALAGRGVRVHVIAPQALRTDIRGTIGFRALEGVEATALPIRVGGFRRGIRQAGVHLIVYRGLRAELERLRPTMLYVEEEPWSLTTLQVSRIARRMNVPFVFHQSQNVSKRLPPPFEAVRRRVLRAAAGATVRLEGAGNALRRAGFAGPTLSIPNVIDPARFEGVAARYAGMDRPVYGFAGRLVAEKGILEFVRAVPRNGSILVVGDGPLLERARAEAEALGLHAHFPGALAHDEIAGAYASMDVLAIPSRSTRTWKEQFGRVAIEAGAAGLPVVATDCGALGDTVRSTGGGVVVSEGDTGALHAALVRLGGDATERARLGEAARRAVATHFTPEAVAKDLHEFFTRLEMR